jgi:hypothetical protein
VLILAAGDKCGDVDYPGVAAVYRLMFSKPEGGY